MVEKYTLKNGIPVFIVQTSSAPVVSVQAWVSRGSIHEKPQEAGISHFLEHALFKGTKRRAVGQIALEIESHGGEVNAFTSFEETVYYATLASRYFEEGLDVIADAIQAPSFDPDEMLREREVILEEIKRAYDSPHKTLSMNLWANAFGGSAYGRPVLGYEKTVRKIDHRTLRAYHSQHYHAGTVSLFVVGDIDKKHAVQLAEKKLGKMKFKRETLPAIGRIPRTRTEMGYVEAEKDVKECHLQIAFPAPEVTDPRVPAMDIVLSAIGQGESSALYQRLVKETNLALDVHLGLVATNHCGLATIALQVAPENIEAATLQAKELLYEFAEKGIRERDIDRVKSSFESEVVAGKETVEGYARRLGYYYIQFQDPSYESRYLEQALAVNAEDAAAALASTLAQAPVLSLIYPKGTASPKKSLAKIFAKARPQKPSKKPTVGLPVTLVEKQNVRFVTRALHHLPVVSVRFLFAGGSREEAKDQLGLTTLFQRVWTSGTRSFSSLEIAHRLESLGASLYAFAGKNTMGISVEFLSKHWPQVKPLLTEIFLEPTFPEYEFKTEKHLLLREILAERDSPGQVCHLNLLSLLYGDHPSGRSSLGTNETVSRLHPDALRTFYKEFIHRRKLVVSTVGAFDTSDWVQELSEICQKLPAAGRAPREWLQVGEPPALRAITETKSPLFQSHLLVGFLGASYQDPERYALKILSSCLAGQGGRLFLELRDRQSLAYTVAPMNHDGPERGLFGFYIGCSPEKLPTAITGIRKEIEKVLKAPMSARELKRAKEFWLGRFELELQRYSAQAMLFGIDECYGLGHDHSTRMIEKVKSLTPEDILVAARKFIKPDKAQFSVVHPTELSSEDVLKHWG